MAFEVKNLSVLAFANSFDMWHYSTPDSVSDIENQKYFDKAVKMLRVGDVIFINSGIDTNIEIRQYGVAIVTDVHVKITLMAG